ncbi:MAG: LTA synthase family protein, partial [Myxococcota bacterium]|nr:LTA synthase family protein [Myxococcota bacterium]
GMKRLYALIPSLIAATALLVALVIFRLELVGELGLSLSQALATGLGRGIAFDVFAVLLSFTIGGIVALVAGRGFTVGFALMGGIVWFSSLASLLHYRFFKIPLDWWIVKNHWGDFAEVQGSARDMAEGQFLPVCIGLYILAVFSVAASDVIADMAGWRSAEPGARPSRRSRLKFVLGSALVLVAMWRMPFWLELGEVNRVIGDHPIRAWLYDATHGKKLFASSGMGWTKGVQLHGEDVNREPPSVQLARYRDYYQVLEGSELAGPSGARATAARDERPLVRTLEPDAENSRALRERLGLPQDEKLNVIVVFLESVRGYELWHPEWGLKLFPRLRSLLDQHASTFDQAYSSSFRAGQTVRGQFSTLCSMLPNTAGAATYIAHTTLRINCIQAFLKQAGYQTAWFNSHYADFHRKRPFEILHGMDQFFDGDYFREQGITEGIGSWGLADAPVLQEALRKMEELASSGQPLFAHALTISTHHPYTVVPEGRVPEELLAATEGNPKYQGYLSRLRYTDDAVSDFLES